MQMTSNSGFRIRLLRNSVLWLSAIILTTNHASSAPLFPVAQIDHCAAHSVIEPVPP